MQECLVSAERWLTLISNGARGLAGVLGQCAALAYLDRSSNFIGPAGAEGLAGVLSQCAALEILDDGEDDIETVGEESLAGVLAHCPALGYLDLKANAIGAAGADQIGAKAGREFCRSASAVHQPVQRVLQECYRSAQR